MGMFTSFDINASGMTAERYRMDIISENVANANTTRTEDGTPYRRKVVVFEEKNSQTPFHQVLNKATDRYSGNGVKVTGVYEDEWTEMNMVYDPSHPDADENGYVTYNRSSKCSGKHDVRNIYADLSDDEINKTIEYLFQIYF